jgi:uncharacterized LabA/DUF88 family protein
MDVVRMVPKMDTMVLISGDGDYTELLEYARSQGVRTEVIAFGKTCSSKLLNEADFVIDMDKSSEKFLIGKVTRNRISSNKGTSKNESAETGKTD